MVKEDGLPLGLGFGLAMNEDAMRGFSSLDDDEKKQVIDAARSIGSKEEMQQFVNSLCAKDYIYRQIDGTLSGGEMKRIEIASVLAKEHSLCIFDEPEAGIDLWSFSMLIQKFEEIHTEKKQSLIVISHQEKIINMADRIMIIDDGEIKKIGTKDEVLPYLNGVQKCHKCVERLEGRS